MCRIFELNYWKAKRSQGRDVMMRPRLYIVVAIFTALVAIVSVESAFAQDGKLKIQVTPKQAYVFVDGDGLH